MLNESEANKFQPALQSIRQRRDRKVRERQVRERQVKATVESNKLLKKSLRSSKGK